MDTAIEHYGESHSALSKPFSEYSIHEQREPDSAVPSARWQQFVRSKRSVGQLDKLVHLLPTGVVLLDAQGRVRDCNAAAASLFADESQTRLTGKLWRDIIAERFQPRLDDGHEISLKNGKRISLLTRSLDDEPGQLIVVNDLTETRELQNQLAQHKRFSDMGKMVSSLAHQIRTPLAAALLHVDNLSGSQRDNANVQKYANKISSRLQNIESQIGDMLFFARGDSELHDEINVSEFFAALKEQVAELEYRFDRCIRWHLNDVPAHLICNKHILIGAILNLVKNAMEASPKDGLLQITSYVSCSPAGQLGLEIQIEDEGPGVNEADLPQLATGCFTTKAKGTGLGLAVVKRVAETHGGRLQLGNRIEGGLRAAIQLPISETRGAR